MYCDSNKAGDTNCQFTLYNGNSFDHDFSWHSNTTLDFLAFAGRPRIHSGWNYSGFSSNPRINLSPFTKDFRGEEQYNESIDEFLQSHLQVRRYQRNNRTMTGDQHVLPVDCNWMPNQYVGQCVHYIHVLIIIFKSPNEKPRRTANGSLAEQMRFTFHPGQWNLGSVINHGRYCSVCSWSCAREWTGAVLYGVVTSISMAAFLCATHKIMILACRNNAVT